MDIISAYREVGSYRGAAAISGTTPKTVKRVIARHESGGAAPERRPRGRNYDGVTELVAERVEKTKGRITAKRLLPAARAVGYEGRRATSGGWSRPARRCGAAQSSWPAAGGVVTGRASGHRLGGAGRAARVLRGAGVVAGAVRALRRQRARRHDAGAAGGVLRAPGWGARCGARRPDGLPEGRGGREQGRAHRRLRAVRRAPRVPARLLRGRRPGVEGDRGEPGRLRQDRPDDPRPRRSGGRRSPTCRGEHRGRGVVCRGQRRGPLRDLRGAGRAAASSSGSCWPRCRRCGPASAGGDPQGRPALAASGSARPATRCRPGSSAPRSRLHVEADRTLSIITGPGEGEVVAEHLLVAPGEASIHDDHYGGPRPAPRRAVRPRTEPEKAFCALGPTAEAFITGAAAAGNTRLGPELVELNTLAAAHGERGLARRPGPGGRVRPLAGRRRAFHPRRRRRDTAPRPRPGTRSCSSCPRVPTRPLSDYALGATHRRPDTRSELVVSAAAPALAPDLADGLRRLKLAAMRQLAPELLLTAKTQRWAPEELLRTLIEAEITARDASNARTRLKTAAFPVVKTLDEFDRAVSSDQPGHPRLPRQPGMDHRAGEPFPGRPGRYQRVLSSSLLCLRRACPMWIVVVEASLSAGVLRRDGTTTWRTAWRSGPRSGRAPGP